MQADSLPGQLLDLLVKTDGIACRREMSVRADGMDLPCRVPRRAGGQLVAFEQDRVLPAEFGEVEQNRAAHDTPANDHDLGVTGQLFAGAGGSR